VSNSAYGSERNIQYASHGETAENHGTSKEVANDNDSDEGTVGPGKTSIKDCTGTTGKTLGTPYIHEIQPYVLARNALSMAQSHPHWYLTTPESLPPIDLEPQKNRTRGRAKGAKNKPT
jgi:hypothetical protein